MDGTSTQTESNTGHKTPTIKKVVMADLSRARAVLMFTGFIIFLTAMTFNSLTGFGERSGVFRQTTEDVTLKYATDVTPAGWSLFVWDFLYVWLLSMFIYFLVGLCRRNFYGLLYTTPAILPYGFHVALIVNLCLNVAWLFLFDRELFWPALVVSGLMVFTNCCILVFSCHGLKVYGAWLNKYNTADLWLIRILVQNGVALYATWGTIATLLNLTIVLHYHTQVSRSNSSMVSLLLLLLILLVWFLFENFYLDLDKHVRYILTIYPVTILVLAGCVTHPGTPSTHIDIFTGVILAVSCIMFMGVRMGMVIWKHHKQPLYTVDTLMMSPLEIARSQRTIFV